MIDFKGWLYMKFIKKFIALFLCLSWTINSVSVCYSLEKCDSNKIWNERYKIENLIKQDLKDGTNFVEKTDNLSGNNEYRVYAYLAEDALSKMIKFLTPDLTEAEFLENLESIKKCEKNIYTKKITYALIASNIVAFLLSGAIVFKDKMFSQKSQGEKVSVKPKENQSEKNKIFKKDTFLKKLINWIFCGLGLGAVMSAVSYLLLSSYLPNHSEEIKIFYDKYENKVAAAKVILANINFKLWEDKDAIGLNFIPYENSPTVVSSDFINIGLNNNENLKTNIENFKAQLEELIRRYDVLC